MKSDCEVSTMSATTEIDNCVICHEPLIDATIVTCENNHDVHVACYRTWRDMNPFPKDEVPCVLRCRSNYRDPFEGYIELIRVSCKYSIFQYMDDILENVLNKDLHSHLLTEVILPSQNVVALERFLLKTNVAWDAQVYGKALLKMFDKMPYKKLVLLLDTLRDVGLDMGAPIYDAFTWHDYIVRHDGVHVLRYMVEERKMNVEKILGSRDKSALYMCIHSRNNKCTNYLLDNNYPLLNYQDAEGWTVLHLATARKNVSLCKKLVEHGCCPSAKNKTGLNVLDLASFHRVKELVEYYKTLGLTLTKNIFTVDEDDEVKDDNDNDIDFESDSSDTEPLINGMRTMFRRKLS